QGGISTDQTRFRETMALNGVYQYANAYRYASRAYDSQPAKPVFLLESTYEHEHPRSDTQPFRKAWWWTMLSGGSGVLWSNAFLWLTESARGPTAWTTATSTTRSRPGRPSWNRRAPSRPCISTRSS